MLSERPNMREDYPREKTSVLTWIVAGLVGAFVLQLVLGSSWFNASSQLQTDLALTIHSLRHGQIWTFATFWLLHEPHNLLHVAFVLGGLYAVGRELEPLLGPRRFVGVFAGAVLLGGLCWAAINWRQGGSLIGATAGIYGLLALYAARFPDREFSFLLFFVFPVTMKPKHIAAALMVTDSAAFVFYDLLGNTFPLAYAPSSHLGGMLAGWIAHKYFQIADPKSFPATTPTRFLRWIPRNTTTSHSPEPRLPAEPAPPKNLRVEVDRILDKINSHGFGALSAEEIRVLAEAKDLLSRR